VRIREIYSLGAAGFTVQVAVPFNSHLLAMFLTPLLSCSSSSPLVLVVISSRVHRHQTLVKQHTIFEHGDPSIMAGKLILCSVLA